MQDHIRALLELDDVNRQRQILVKQRLEREKLLKQAEQGHAAARQAADEAQAEAERHDALIRQYHADIERCDQTVEKLRAQQLEATTNKAYLACINGIENAKSEKKVRQDSLANLETRVSELQEHAKALEEKAEAAKAKVHEVEQANAAQAEAEASEAELDRIYEEKKQHVEAKFLEHYERLISARHPRPLMRVDPRTRATPMGNCISTNALESLRLGQMITDPASNAILYVDEQETKVEKQE